MKISKKNFLKSSASSEKFKKDNKRKKIFLSPERSSSC
jgi:hypothetical protein